MNEGNGKKSMNDDGTLEHDSNGQKHCKKIYALANIRHKMRVLKRNE